MVDLLLRFHVASLDSWEIFRIYFGSTPNSGCNRHHQDYEPFLVGNPHKPSFVTVTGGGETEDIFNIFIHFGRRKAFLLLPGFHFPLGKGIHGIHPT